METDTVTEGQLGTGNVPGDGIRQISPLFREVHMYLVLMSYGIKGLHIPYDEEAVVYDNSQRSVISIITLILFVLSLPPLYLTYIFESRILRI